MRGNLDAVANGKVMHQGDDDSVEAQASENNSESDDSEAVPGAFESMTTPISADPVSDESNEHLDDLDVVEWIDELDFSGHHTNSEYRIQTSQFHKWRGVNWNTLAIVRPAEKTVGLFLGFDNFPELPADWHCNIRFVYSFLGDDGSCLIQCELFIIVFCIVYL